MRENDESMYSAPVDDAEIHAPSGKDVLNTDIANSIDMLVDYLVDNEVDGIHPLIMGEIERRLIIKALQRSRGNKLRAAKLLGISRNTLHRKFRQLLTLENGIEDAEV